MKILTIIYLSLLLCSCSYDNFDNAPHKKPPTQRDLVPLSSVVSLYIDKPITITKDVTTWGYVTSSDVDDNFYKTIVIEQGRDAIEIKAGLYSLHTLYPEGSVVTLNVKGLCIAPERGVMQIGIKAGVEALYPVAYFGYKPLLDKYLSCTDKIEKVAPELRTILSLNDSDYGRLVRVEGLTFKSKSDELAIYEDSDGNIIGLHISTYSKLNSLVLPVKAKSLCGIVEKRTVDKTLIFAIKPRYTDDIEADL